VLRVMLFIDGMNLYHALKENQVNTDVDFHKLSQKLAGANRLIRTYYYHAPYDQTQEPGKYKDQLYRPRFIGHSVAHIQAAFSTGLQAILLAWAGVR